MKVISLMILVQEITAFSADVRETLPHRIPSPPPALCGGVISVVPSEGDKVQAQPNCH